jgi:H+/Cl- antiporter ClcA
MKSIDKGILALSIPGILYSVYAIIVGRVVSYQKFGASEIFYVELHPKDYWITVLAYLVISLLIILFGIKRCLPNWAFKVLNFNEKTKLSLTQVLFILVSAIIIIYFVLTIGGKLASA